MNTPRYSDYLNSYRLKLNPFCPKDRFMEPPCAFANVVLDLPNRELREKLFSYAIPQILQPDTFAGTQVLVPFGKHGQATGYVVSLDRHAPLGIEPKPILEVLDAEPLFEAEYVSFLRWIADYYCTSLSEVVSAAVPSFLTPKIKRRVRFASGLDQKQLNHFDDTHITSLLAVLGNAKGGSLSMLTLRQKWRKLTRGTQTQFYRAFNLLKDMNILELSPEQSDLQTPKLVRSAISTGKETDNKRYAEIIKILEKAGGQMNSAELLKAARTTASTLLRMANQNLILFKSDEIIRDPLQHLNRSANVAANARTVPELTESQSLIWQVLSNDLRAKLNQTVNTAYSAANSANQVKPWLLHGVTGSGKTEIYLRLIEKTLQLGKTALLLVPEIALTPQLARRLTDRFGNAVAIWHSALSAGERYDTWRRLRLGQARVLLGTRSAVLVNLSNLGLIILDEEHDSSYKQATPNPRYHAKTVAIEKATRCGAAILFGSATPDVATYYEAIQNRKLLELPTRIFDQAMPEVKIVDMREEFLNGNRSYFSESLLQAIQTCNSKGEQSILLLNRRGYASHVFCRACGFIVKCKNCSVALVYHQTQYKSYQGPNGKNIGHLACHHCGLRMSIPSQCADCSSRYLTQYGMGTQRVEQELKALFTDAKILRLDSDVATKKGAHEKILHHFAEGQADILIGTQMVAKGLDIERVTLVGVLAADAAFNLPDYRSTERGFQLLTQVAGRAGRGKHPGTVIFQTYNSDMLAMTCARNHDYAKFYENEVEARSAHNYPPFSQLIRVVVAAEDPLCVEKECDLIAEELAHYLESALDSAQIQILGPAPCLIERLNNKFRMHLLIKNLAGKDGQKRITNFFSHRKPSKNALTAMDVDALDLI